MCPRPPSNRSIRSNRSNRSHPPPPAPLSHQPPNNTPHLTPSGWPSDSSNHREVLEAVEAVEAVEEEAPPESMQDESIDPANQSTSDVHQWKYDDENMMFAEAMAAEAME